MLHDLPRARGLYDPRFEHDACGVSFVVDIKGRASHDLVLTGLVGMVGVERQECKSHSVRATFGQGAPGDAAQEPVGTLQQDSGAVTGVGFGAGCTAVFHAAQRTEPGENDVVRGATLDIDDERHTARVMFEARVVQATRTRQIMQHVSSSLPKGSPAWTVVGE